MIDGGKGVYDCEWKVSKGRREKERGGEGEERREPIALIIF